MGSEPEPEPNPTIKLVWIDKKINNSENKNYQSNFRSLSNISLNCFENVNDGINFLKQIEFERIIIITSGSIYSEFISSFKANINNFRIAPRIIILLLIRIFLLKKINQFYQSIILFLMLEEL